MGKDVKKVLILEDEDTSLTVMNEAVKKAGYDTRPFQRPDSDCINTMVNEQIDLILLDLGLFNFDAAKIMTFLHEKKVAKGVPIIVVSGKTPQEIEQAAKELKAKAWFQKPVKTEDVVEKVKKTIG